MPGKYPMKKLEDWGLNPITAATIAAELDADGLDPIIAELLEVDDGDEIDETEPA
ncbi:MAG TPA: hypothetical protein VMW33_05930 [Ilumatobacteraceae bacterium]|nr:hypothetical protein [Ilumatobacteraceae bacterium]